jgi:hypothetical protein
MNFHDGAIPYSWGRLIRLNSGLRFNLISSRLSSRQ